VALLLIAGGVLWYANNTLESIDRFTSRLKPEDRATKATEGPAAEALNILMLGTDKGSRNQTIKEELSDGEWNRGAFRSDTMMVLHIPASRDHAYLVSLPRDSYVEIPGERKQKINAAFSLGGPDLAVQTVENLTGVYIDHIAMVDWAGFKDLTSIVGGVEVTIPETFSDPNNGNTWEKGTHQLEGQEALDYVRTRYGLPNGDIDRIQRQQNFLRATMEKTLEQGRLTNPLKLRDLMNAVADNMTVDSDFSAGEMRGLAREMSSLRGNDVTYLTAPVAGYDDIDGVGSVVLLEKRESKALWRALAEDDMQSYLDEYGGTRLGDPGTIH
jgi:LCP family protein required for cell wall assembly